MKELTIFGKKYTVVEKKSNKDSVRLKDGKIMVNYCERTPYTLLKEFITKLLYSKLDKIYDDITKDGKIDIFGNLDFEVVGNIDKKRKRIAKLEGNKILLKENAIALDKNALKYILAHEIAHTFTKKHNDKFWKIVKTIYPGFNKGKNLFMKFEPMSSPHRFNYDGG